MIHLEDETIRHDNLRHRGHHFGSPDGGVLRGTPYRGDAEGDADGAVGNWVIGIDKSDNPAIPHAAFRSGTQRCEFVRSRGVSGPDVTFHVETRGSHGEARHPGAAR